MFASLRAAPHEIKERQFKRPVRGEPMIAHAELLTNRLDAAEVRLQPFEVLFASQVRVNVKIASRFHIMEQHRFVEIKAQLRRVQNVEDNDFVTTGAQR